jgi:hypothetical protein
MVYSRFSPGICLEELRKTTEGLRQDGLCPYRALTENESRAFLCIPPVVARQRLGESPLSLLLGKYKTRRLVLPRTSCFKIRKVGKKRYSYPRTRP